MKKSIAFFNLSITGHHLEYLYHLSKNIELLGDTTVYFIVNYGFKELFQKTFGDNVHSKIQLVEITIKESQQIKSRHKFVKYYHNFRILKKYLFQIKNIETCFLMDIYPFLWFLCCIRLNVKFSAIYFIPILMPGVSLLDKIKIFVLRKSIKKNRWHKIFVLNNPDIAQKLNRQYHSQNLFESIVDPLFDIKSLTLNKEKELHTFSDRISFLHIGSISERKGTMEILDALELLPEDILGRIECIIAGETSVNLSQKIQNKIDKIKRYKNFDKLHFLNKKLSYFEFDYLFSGCSYVLIPYLISDMSSGIVLHAFNYNKPIIGPSQGIIAQIIRQNDAGICIKPKSFHIAKAIEELVNTPIKIDHRQRTEFLALNSPLHFVQKIGNTIN